MKYFIDFETRSRLDLRKCGVDVYSRHPSTEVLCMAIAEEGDREATVFRGFTQYFSAPHAVFVAHNAAFELAIWNNILVPRFGWSRLEVDKVECTMAMGLSMSLPAGLEDMCKALGLKVEKDMEGQRLMLQMSKPRKVSGDKVTWWEDSERMERLKAYCQADVLVTRELYKHLKSLTPSEKKLWVLDRKINDTGVLVDLPMAHRAVQLLSEEKDRLDTRMNSLTHSWVSTCGASVALADWCTKKGWPMASVDKASVDTALGLSIPAGVRQALTLKKEASKSSTAKLQKMSDCACPDGRIRGMFQFYGANTGRWAGRQVQLHNMPRGTLKPEQIAQVFRMLEDKASAEDFDNSLGSPMSLISSCIRGFLVPEPGKVFTAVDFRQVESRVRSWIAGDEGTLEVYRGDGKVYEYEASKIYGVEVSQVTKDQRQVGKVADLALGYGGGVGAFQTMAKVYGVVMPDDQASSIKYRWRAAHTPVVQFWYALERDAISAVTDRAGRVFGKEIKWVRRGSFLWCKLPSGRNLSYPFPKVTEGDYGNKLQYMSLDTYTKKWSLCDTYGGSLCENVVQAISRDLLSEAMLRVDEAGYRIVMHIHDELVVEHEEKEGAPEHIESIVVQIPSWATGLPMEVERWTDRRYRK